MQINKTIDYIIILGSGIRTEEVPPLLKSRLDKAITYYQRNKNAQLVVSGGRGPDEPISEAEAMARYLYSQGIPKDAVIKEDASTTTFENMKFSKEKILDKLDNKSSIKDKVIIFSTNNYHVLRAAIYARKAHLKAQGVGAPTAHYFLPTALIREYAAIVVLYRWLFIGLALLVILLLICSLFPI